MSLILILILFGINTKMRKVGVVGYEQTPMLRDAGAQNEVELIMSVVHKVLKNLNITQRDIDFTCSGSCDYLQGVSFAFVDGLNAVSAVPPIKESHVEMDAAWALYEAWLKIQSGQAEIALVYGFGKSSPGEIREILSLQLDPYYMSPLWPDSVSIAALQARLLLEKGIVTEEEMACVVQESRRNALNNPNAQLSGDFSLDDLISEPYFVSPLKKHDCSPITDGASVMVIASEEKAKELHKCPAYINGFDHRIETGQIGMRDLTISTSVEISAKELNLDSKNIQVAELHAPFSHQQLILKKALNLSDNVVINQSGGPLAGNIVMTAGLDRIGAIFQQLQFNSIHCGLAHATSGPCLQQNMLVLLEDS